MATSIEIKNVFTQDVIYRGKGTFKDVLLEAIAKNVDLRALDASKQDLSGMDITEALNKRTSPLSFEKGSFNGANLNEALISKADLSNVSFLKAEAKNASLLDCKIDATLFTSVTAPGITIRATDIVNSYFTESDFSQAKFDVNHWSGSFLNSNLENAEFKEKSKMYDVDFGMSNLSYIKLSKIVFEVSNLGTAIGQVKGANFKGSTFKGTRLGLTEYIKSDFSFTQWREETQVRSITMKDCNMHSVSMHKASLERVHLKNTDMSQSDITAKWTDSNFIDANFNKCNFNYCDLTKNHFERVQAKEADFGQSDISGASIEGSDWTTSILRNTIGKNIVLTNSQLAYNQFTIKNNFKLPFAPVMKKEAYPDLAADNGLKY